MPILKKQFLTNGTVFFYTHIYIFTYICTCAQGFDFQPFSTRLWGRLELFASVKQFSSSDNMSMVFSVGLREKTNWKYTAAAFAVTGSWIWSQNVLNDKDTNQFQTIKAEDEIFQRTHPSHLSNNLLFWAAKITHFRFPFENQSNSTGSSPSSSVHLEERAFSKESHCADRTAYQGLQVAKCTGFTLDSHSVDTVNVAELLTEDHLPTPPTS